MEKLFIILTVFLLIKCTATFKSIEGENEENFVVYSVDKDGLYLFNELNETTKKIADLKEIFIDNSLKLLNDSVVIIGFTGQERKIAIDKITGKEIECPCSSTDSLIIKGIVSSKKYDQLTLYRESFQAINIRNDKTWLYRSINYEHKNWDTLTVRTSTFKYFGAITSVQDTVLQCSKITFSSGRLKFCPPERFYAESNSVNKKQVFSRKGNLYLKENGKETMLLEYDGEFSSKFGSGYFQPNLSPTGEKVVFRYLAGFLKPDSGLFELDLKTMKKRRITNHDYFRPTYSPDGNHLLLGNNQRHNESNNTWLKDIFILDLKTGSTKKIGEGNFFIWKN